MTGEQLTLDDFGREARDTGVAAATVDDTWRAVALGAIAAMARTGAEFVAYDLVTEQGCPEPSTPAQWGALLHTAARLGLIEPAGYASSPRPTTARSAVRTWRGVTR